MQSSSSSTPGPVVEQRSVPISRPKAASVGNGQNVLTRLHGLFPPSPLPSSPMMPKATPRSARQSPISPAKKASTSAQPKFLKIRLLTWNMHDSVPKGDLQELFGKVPPYTPSNVTATGSANQFPVFPNDNIHPYHLIVVAGQECPSSSGIPMGLGAGFKLQVLDKDKDKSREKLIERSRSQKYKDKDESDDNEDSYPENLSGWTSMVEDWLCYNNVAGQRNTLPSTLVVGSPRPLLARYPSKDARRGPYQLLVKERLMGIYLAIYVHREVKPFVRGSSKSAVTAGLIGGRLGNKGGVGISLNVDGTTLLFLNAHLAAHEGKVKHRLANLGKIKGELVVDDFLQADDPRVMSEDLTDKFDFTFLCGDLNFRLDISRLHADWLISRKEYAQALAFDQLRNIMKTGQAFVGFHEAPIDFPPTFKYDVLRTLKRAKHGGSKHGRLGRNDGQPDKLTEREERELEALEAQQEDEDGEGASMASSVWTSAHSRADTDGEVDDNVRLNASPKSPSRSPTGNAHGLYQAAHRAKERWLSLLSLNSASRKAGQKTPPTPERQRADRLSVKSAEALTTKPLLNMSGRAASLDAVNPTSSTLRAPVIEGASDDEDEGDDKGVYDSSNKKRVPSWCDRILWKSTVFPAVETVAGDLTKPRNRVGQFFSNAFRPLSMRTRRESWTSETSPKGVAFSEGPLTESPRSAPLSKNAEPPSPDQLYLTKSHEGQISSDSPLRRSRTTATPAPAGKKPTRTQRRAWTTGLGTPSRTETTETFHVLSPMRWRFLPSFLANHNPPSIPVLSPIETIPTTPRRGDAICTSYRSLDDHSMRKLEGRSDHRPVIGSFAIYV